MSQHNNTKHFLVIIAAAADAAAVVVVVVVVTESKDLSATEGLCVISNRSNDPNRNGIEHSRVCL